MPAEQKIHLNGDTTVEVAKEKIKVADDCYKK